MTYDEWKTTEPDDPYGPPPKCETCGHREGYCDCPCCHEEDAQETALIQCLREEIKRLKRFCVHRDYCGFWLAAREKDCNCGLSDFFSTLPKSEKETLLK